MIGDFDEAIDQPLSSHGDVPIFKVSHLDPNYNFTRCWLRSRLTMFKYRLETWVLVCV